MIDRKRLADAISDFFSAAERAWDGPTECVNAVLTAISEQGYVIVPKEPSRAMIEAIDGYYMEGAADCDGGGFIPKQEVPVIWEALITASQGE